MKTELRARRHSILPEAFIFEVWHNGIFLATVTGADGPGVRIISKYLTNIAEDICIELHDVPVLNVKLRPE